MYQISHRPSLPWGPGPVWTAQWVGALLRLNDYFLARSFTENYGIAKTKSILCVSIQETFTWWVHYSKQSPKATDQLPGVNHGVDIFIFFLILGFLLIFVLPLLSQLLRETERSHFPKRMWWHVVICCFVVGYCWLLFSYCGKGRTIKTLTIMARQYVVSISRKYYDNLFVMFVN